MEFRYQYVVAMQEQNRKMYRHLRDTGELDRFIQLKANEAHRLYLELTRDTPTGPDGQLTLQAAREAEEQVKAMMFEFPDVTTTAEQDELKALFNEVPPSSLSATEFSVTKDLPYILMDDPDPLSSLESLERRLAELQAMPDYVSKKRDVEILQRIIGIRKAVEAEAPPPDGE